MAAEQDGSSAFPSALEKLFRPLSSGVQRLVSSPDSQPVEADDWIDTESKEAPNSRGNYGLERASRPSDEIIRTPEETIHAILTRNEGKMKQAEIAEMMDYSESTVSRKLSNMESAGTITRYQIGRGKVVFLPDAIPESFDSPLARLEAQ